MNRRTFIQAAGATGVGLTGELRPAEANAPGAALLKLLEDSPPEHLPRALAQRIRGGLRYEELLATLTWAAVRNVQPYPVVGYKYHSVMVLRSIDASTEHLSSPERWLPIIWAADYFKSAQAEERASSAWRQPQRHASAVDGDAAARGRLIAALEHWDRDAADAAMVNYAAVAPMEEIFSLLFGEVIGVASNEILPTAALGICCLLAIAFLYRPLLLTSLLPDVGEARGIRPYRMEMCFLVAVALATTMTVPVVGAFLMFSLMIAPAGTARTLTSSPHVAMGLSAAIALFTVWLAIVMSYETNWPIGFFVGALGVAFYGVARAFDTWQHRRIAESLGRKVVAQS